MHATLHASGGHMNRYHDWKLSNGTVVTLTIEQAATLNSSPAPDFRYIQTACVTCGRRFQQIDFFGQQHTVLCESPFMSY